MTQKCSIDLHVLIRIYVNNIHINAYAQVEVKQSVTTNDNGQNISIKTESKAPASICLGLPSVTGIEKGIISIRYNIKELRWVKSDSEGDYFFRPFNAKDVGIESWEVFLPSHDIARQILKNEMVRRKNLFLKALEENDVSILPRLIDDTKRSKCPYCPFYDKCINQDSETNEAKEMAKEIDLLDIRGVVDLENSATH